MNPQIHILARAVIEDNGHFLLTHFIGGDNTFLPGGHWEAGEGMVSCLQRELLEELGVTVQVGEYLGAVEAMWQDEKDVHHEINHCFAVKCPALRADQLVRSREAHLEFLWVHCDDFAQENLLPMPMRELLVEWLYGRHEVRWRSALS